MSGLEYLLGKSLSQIDEKKEMYDLMKEVFSQNKELLLQHKNLENKIILM